MRDLLKHELLKHELLDDQLDAAAGGGTYTDDGFLKTASTYSCGHFQCKDCPATGKHSHTTNGSGCYDVTINPNCHWCRWHSTLKCSNPANMKT